MHTTQSEVGGGLLGLLFALLLLLLSLLLLFGRTALGPIFAFGNSISFPIFYQRYYL